MIDMNTTKFMNLVYFLLFVFWLIGWAIAVLRDIRNAGQSMKLLPYRITFVSLFCTALFLPAGLFAFAVFIIYYTIKSARAHLCWLRQLPDQESRFRIPLVILKWLAFISKYGLFLLAFLGAYYFNGFVQDVSIFTHKLGSQIVKYILCFICVEAVYMCASAFSGRLDRRFRDELHPRFSESKQAETVREKAGGA